MKKIKYLLLAAFVIVISTINLPGKSNKYSAEHIRKSANIGKMNDEKLLMNSRYNCDPKMLVPGDPDIDPKMLIPGDPNIDPELLLTESQ